MTIDPKADTIAEELLYLTGKGILEHDDDLFLDAISLPMVMETSEGCQLITTEDEILGILRSVRNYMRENDYVDLVRTTVAAKFVDENTVEATHVSVMVGKNGETTRPPYPVHSVIRRFDGQWKLQSSMYVILDNDAQNKALAGGTKAMVHSRTRS